MKSKIGAVVALLMLASNNEVNAHRLSAQHRQMAESSGIFGKMIEQATAGERLEKEKHEASLRKQQQLAEAEKEHERLVAEEEAEEAAARKKQEDEAEAAALEAAKNSPQAKMMAAANDAASSINIGDLEANIQANLQAKIASGASQAELMAAAQMEDMSSA